MEKVIVFLAGLWLTNFDIRQVDKHNKKLQDDWLLLYSENFLVVNQ